LGENNKPESNQTHHTEDLLHRMRTVQLTTSTW
jgi:hypothetical protein